tara:strand:+ start:645 stop:950 length:306 start_codon:yes stop_codon:yes gene_type:complete
MSVRDLLNTIDSKELTEWVAFDSIEPIGAIRTDLVGGIISSTIANCHRGKNQSPFSPTDFMPLHESKKENCTEEIGAKLAALSLMTKAIKEVRHDDIDVED